jgi:anti-sigma regulatory factor (Ser/Thr protein kinase)
MPRTSNSHTTETPAQGQFRHEAVLYDGASGFVESVLPFVRDAVAADEPILVAVARRNAELLREGLGDDVERVSFADMEELGRNPTGIIAAWEEHVGTHSRDGRRIRGVGEPVWPGRNAAELTECEHHESLLNLAFADAASFWLLCPYDAAALDDDVLAAARHNHPSLLENGKSRPSPEYHPPGTNGDPLAAPLPPPAEHAEELSFGPDDLHAVRGFAATRAQAAGLGRERTFDLMLAVNEIATNSLRHAGGSGTLRLWSEPGELLCEVSDDGRIDDPLVGRHVPVRDLPSGRGLWIVNRLCDLVQIRSRSNETAVRLHMTLD